MACRSIDDRNRHTRNSLVLYELIDGDDCCWIWFVCVGRYFAALTRNFVVLKSTDWDDDEISIVRIYWIESEHDHWYLIRKRAISTTIATFFDWELGKSLFFACNDCFHIEQKESRQILAWKIDFCPINFENLLLSSKKTHSKADCCLQKLIFASEKDILPPKMTFRIPK